MRIGGRVEQEEDEDGEEEEEVVEAAEGGGRREGEQIDMDDEEEQLVGTVEVAWNGKIERVCFPLPLEAKYLSEKSKKRFLQEVDLSTCDKRMAALVASVEGHVGEMEYLFQKAEQSPVFRFLHKFMPPFKTGLCT